MNLGLIISGLSYAGTCHITRSLLVIWSGSRSLDWSRGGILRGNLCWPVVCLWSLYDVHLFPWCGRR